MRFEHIALNLMILMTAACLTQCSGDGDGDGDILNYQDAKPTAGVDVGAGGAGDHAGDVVVSGVGRSGRLHDRTPDIERRRKAFRFLGHFKITYYYVVHQDDYKKDNNDTPLYGPKGEVLATVPEAFACALGMEGSGILSDGRLLNYFGDESICPAVTDCAGGGFPSKRCYKLLNRGLYPFGQGVKSRALRPFLSVAVDPGVIPYGSVLYLEQLDGVMMPDGTVHSGCVRADDTGHGVEGLHLDYFVAKESFWRQLDPRLPPYVKVTHDPGKCADELNAYEAIGASCKNHGGCPYPGGRCLNTAPYTGGYCSTGGCAGNDCPDIGGYDAFCGSVKGAPSLCFSSCLDDDGCRYGYVCASVDNLGKGLGSSKGCIPSALSGARAPVRPRCSSGWSGCM